MSIARSILYFRIVDPQLMHHNNIKLLSTIHSNNINDIASLKFNRLNLLVPCYGDMWNIKYLQRSSRLFPAPPNVRNRLDRVSCEWKTYIVYIVVVSDLEEATNVRRDFWTY